MRIKIPGILIILFSITSFANSEAPYEGQQQREIKSLSQSEIEGYMAGKGMGFARPAELNHYPGPRHVLDLSDKLGLSNEQRQQTQILFDKMQASAITLGKQLVDLEKNLDQLFMLGSVSEQPLEKALQEIALTRAKLRYVHLSAHLEQKQLLSEHQTLLYDQLRGYANNGHAGSQEHHHTGNNHNQ